MKKSFLLFLIIFLLWSVYRYFTNFPEWVDEVIFKTLIFVLPTYIFIRTEKERAGVAKSFGISKKFLIRTFLIGAGAGVGLILYSFFVRSVFLRQSLQLNLANLSPTIFFLNVLVSFFTAFNEELVFRGYMMQQMQKSLRHFPEFTNAMITISVSTVFFALAHLPRILFSLHYSLFDLGAYLYLLVFLGVINALVFWKTKDTKASTATHFLWNFFSVLTLYK